MIKQKTEFDCGFAVAAMLCGVTYDNACEWDPDPDAMRGLTPSEMAELIWDIATEHHPELEQTHEMPRGVHISAHTVEDWVGRERDKDHGYALMICRPSGGDAHWVATKHGVVYDPEEDDPHMVEDFKHSHWIVKAYVAHEFTAQRGKGKGKGKK